MNGNGKLTETENAIFYVSYGILMDKRKRNSGNQACLQSLTKVLDSPWHRFLRKVIPDHLQSCLKLLSCWWLTSEACGRLSAWRPTHDNHPASLMAIRISEWSHCSWRV